MKIAICGHGQSGKDEAAEWFSRNTRLRYAGGTSKVIAPLAAARLGVSEAEAFATRHTSRDLWFALGVELRGQDPAYLARVVLGWGDIVVGIRDRAEMETTLREGLVSLAVWVARPGVPAGPTMKYGSDLCDIVLENDSGLPEYHAKLRRLVNALGVLKNS